MGDKQILPIKNNHYLLLLFSLVFLFGCSEQQSTVKNVMDNVVTRFYVSMNEEELSKLTNEKVMSLLNEDELEVLSSQYWMFDVNVSSIVSIMRDTRQKITPYWIEKTGFKKTKMIVKNEKILMKFGKRSFLPDELN